IQGQVGRVALAQALNAVPAAARLERLFPVYSRINGSVEATWNDGIQGLRAVFDLNAQPEAAAPGDVFPLTGNARGSLRYNREIDLTLAQSQFETPHSSLQARGTLGQAGSHLSISYTTSSFQETARLLGALTGHSKAFPLTLRSAATFKGILTGTLADPSVRGQIDLGQFSYKGWDWQSLQGGVSASPEGIAIKAGYLRSGKSVFNFDASASLTSWKVTTSSQLALSATATRSPLQGLEDVFAVRFPLRGVASGELKIAGPPANLAGEGSFQLMDGSFAGERFQRLSGRVLVTGSAFDFRNVTLQKGAGKLTGEAKVVWPSRSFSMKFQGGNFSLGDFETLQGRMPGSEAGREEKPLQGVLGLVAEGSGKLNDPEIRSSVTIQDLALEGKPAGKLEADFRLAGDRLTGVGRLRGAEGESDFNTTIGMHGDWRVELNGKLVNFRLDPWISLSGGNLATPVVASGSVSISGPLKERAKISAVADIRSLGVEIPGFSLTNSRPVAIRFKNGLIESSSFEMRGPSTRLQIHLSGRLGPPAHISLNAVGSAQASLLGILDPSIKAVGNIMLNLHAEGNPARPSLSGEIQVRDLSLRSEDLPLPLSGLNGTVLLDGNRATLKSFGEKNGQTSIRMSGYVTLGPNPVFNLQADFAHVRLEYPAGFTSLLTGQVRLRGPVQNPELTGEAVVGQMFADENFNVVDWIGQMGQSFQTPPTRGLQEFPSSVRLDVRVMTSPTVQLNSRTLSYTGSIDLTLRGALARPAITGSIHLSQGQALVAGVRYQINRGDITMTNPTQIGPMVDIEAQTRVERYNLTIEISGSADHPRISYRSDPPLPTEQIVSLLALGYAPQQALISSTGPARMGAIGAGSLLTQALSNQVSGRFQRLFGASRIRIDPNLLGPSTAGGARVTVEEKVSKDVTITYSTNTAAAQQRDIRMRWDVSNKISLIGERDINGVYGFEVRFRRRVR
ncbi:MAG: translocation/assembly module TamB domain-containing protein, partial [Acidobacteriota bacterium]|nr:translocation/assembly module TamB domain-containing protein [Acidobacteriota bacterium]